MEDSERIFTELIRSIEKRRTEVKQLIRNQEQAAVKQAEQRLAQLELELDGLRWKETELKQLSNTDDPIHFLQVTEIFLNKGLKTTDFSNSYFCLYVYRVAHLSLSLDLQTASLSVLFPILRR